MENDYIHLTSLLKNLVACSKKAAHIAQICRSDPELFSLLIQEKKDGEKNMRFVHDFKTLADVLVQETVRWNISKEFPQLRSNIFGEENHHFENALGESVEVKVFDSPPETVSLLTTVLDGRHECAEALCGGIYKNVAQDIVVSEAASKVVLAGNSVGVWIDPIDCTGEYIHGSEEEIKQFASKGLRCVCVVIGVFELNTGCPIAGVVNQPFFTHDASQNRWLSKYYWALCHQNVKETSLEPLPSAKTHKKKKIVISSSENEKLVQIMASKYNVHQVSGSGYKALLVACGDVDLYVLSHPTTYFWDTCGPSALLAAIGGGIVDFKKIVAEDHLNPDDLSSYRLKCKFLPGCGQMFCNTGGVIAYHDTNSLMEFLTLLKENNFYIQE